MVGDQSNYSSSTHQDMQPNLKSYLLWLSLIAMMQRADLRLKHCSLWAHSRNEQKMTGFCSRHDSTCFTAAYRDSLHVRIAHVHTVLHPTPHTSESCIPSRWFNANAAAGFLKYSRIATAAAPSLGGMYVRQ